MTSNPDRDTILAGVAYGVGIAAAILALPPTTTLFAICGLAFCALLASVFMRDA